MGAAGSKEVANGRERLDFRNSKTARPLLAPGRAFSAFCLPSARSPTAKEESPARVPRREYAISSHAAVRARP